MTENDLRHLLTAVAQGSASVDEAVEALKQGPFRETDLPFATLDFHRELRQGVCEVVLGASKTTEQILLIADRFAEGTAPTLITRLQPDQIDQLQERFPDARANREAGVFLLNPRPPLLRTEGEPFVAIVSAGTSDFRTVEEAAEVCVAMEVPFEKIQDVGVAGLHRLLRRLPLLQQATAIVVVAGMEGALASVVAGLVGCPVFAVPTSVGYGAHLGGVAALLGMLNACAPGITVTNIDNGFSAAFSACKVVQAVQAALAGTLSQTP